jgi:hypothetical protein
MTTLLRPLTRPFPLLLRTTTTLLAPSPALRLPLAKRLGRAYTNTKTLSAATMASVQQAEWRPPAPLSESLQQALPKLSMYNSLTRSKNEFVPLDREGKKIGWYACGPTVYDDAVSFPLYRRLPCGQGVECWSLSPANLFASKVFLRQQLIR